MVGRKVLNAGGSMVGLPANLQLFPATAGTSSFLSYSGTVLSLVRVPRHGPDILLNKYLGIPFVHNDND